MNELQAASENPEWKLEEELKIAKDYMTYLDSLLKTNFLSSEKMTLVDLALLPFVRQYAFIDKPWFDKQEWNNVNRWLNLFLNSKSFKKIQQKHKVWQKGDKPIIF